MKNIAFFSIFVIISASAFSQEKKYTFYFDIDFGLIHGQALEYVYQLPDYTIGELLSELKWDMKPVGYFGMQLNFAKTNIMNKPGLYSAISGKFGFPGKSGFMEDRDWDEIGKGDLTHFSKHTNITHNLYIFDAAVGVSIPVKDYFYLIPFISGSWMKFNFSGVDGYGEYPYFEPAYQYIDFTGQTVITYEQNWLLAAAGLTIGTKALVPFAFDLSFHISPLTFCGATDEHLTTKVTYKDYPRYGLFFEPKFNVSYFYKGMDFNLGFSYRHISQAKGDSYYSRNGSDYFPGANKAGAGLSLFDIKCGVRVRL